jgi:hypothetical protein
MFHRRALWIAVITAGFSGCTALQSVGSQTRAWLASLKPESYVNDNPQDDPGDPWIEAAGLEARADQTRESSGDPLGVRRFTMSEKARSIERNMGIDD